MVDVIFQQQVQLRQQRQGIEEARRRLISQQNLRQAQDRNVALQRQQQLKQLSQAEQQITSQDIQLQQMQSQQSQLEQLQSKDLQKQEALRVLVEKGKGSSALYSLSPKERAQIESIASEIKASRERSAGIVAVSKVEQTLSSSLNPELRKQVFLQGASGQFSIELPKLESKFQQLTQPQFTPANQVTIQQRPQSIVAPAKTFTQQAKDIIFAPVERTRKGGINIPGQVRKIAPLTSLTFSTGVAKVEQKLKEFGIGKDSPVFRETKIPVSKIVGDVALGSLLVGLGGSAGQVAVRRYVKDGRVYYVDDAGQVIGSESVEQASKNIAEFKQALDESAIFKKAGSRYYNEPNLRERTRELINKASPQQLKSLKELYKKSGRLDLYNDILAQEKDIIVRTNIQSKATAKAIKDRPAQLTGVGQVTSQFAGTGQYERTNAVAVSRPREGQQINQNLGLEQTGFQFEQLGLSIKSQPKSLVIAGTILKTRQQSSPVNQLGLRTESQTKQGSEQARALLSAFRNAQATRQQSRQATQQRTQLDFGKPRGRDRGKPRLPKTPFGFKLPSDQISSSKIGKKASSLIGIEVRRRGKFELLGTETNLERALRKASNIVDINLARSFRLRSTETGELLDLGQLPIGFRRAKRESRTFVEESSRALSQFGEKKEIKYFKNTKSRKSLL